VVDAAQMLRDCGKLPDMTTIVYGMKKLRNRARIGSMIFATRAGDAPQSRVSTPLRLEVEACRWRRVPPSSRQRRSGA